MARIKRLLMPGLVALSLPVTFPAAARFFRPDDSNPSYGSFFPTDAEQTFYDTFHVEREPKPKPDLPPFVHHEFLVRGREDGFNIRLNMTGVNKKNFKVWMERDELIAEGKMEMDFEDEDEVLIRYRMSRPPAEVFNLDATKAEIKNGILTVYVPKKDQDEFAEIDGVFSGKGVVV